jgi:hypothetical protein
MYPEKFLEIPTGLPLYFAGDAFGGPRVEGAALSGMALASHLSNSRIASGNDSLTNGHPPIGVESNSKG